MEEVDDLKDDARLRIGPGGGGMGVAVPVNVDALDVRIEDLNKGGEEVLNRSFSVLNGGGEMNSLTGFMGDCKGDDTLDGFFFIGGCSNTVPTVEGLSLPIVVGVLVVVAGGQYLFPIMRDFFGFLSGLTGGST
jgi:hypothetical protein